MKTMSASLKKRFGSLYWQQFFLTAGMVLLTMLLLGVSFFALSYNYTVSEKRDEMNERAKLMASVSVPFLEAADSGQSDDQEENLMSMARVASMVSNVNFLIGDANGNILLTTDEQFVNKTITLPADVTQQIVSEGCYEGRTRLGSMYQLKQYVVGVPAVDSQSGELVGIILAVMENRSLMQMWRSFIGLFFMTSAIILLIAFVVSSLTSMRQIQPIREMVQATRAYGSGEFDVRMQDSDRTDEIGELAASFNAMADSLQETERQRRDFIANISHELKTPMTTIAGYTDGILDGTIPPERERQYLQIISDESRRLSRLVRRMLDISQIQSKEMKKEEFDLCESMRLALLSMEQKINERGLDVDADIPEDSVMVLGDNDLITQVIYNLLENATKFATPGSKLYLGLSTGAETAVVTVRNHGSTIPPESGNFISDENLFNYQAKVLRELLNEESYICVGRAADFVLRDKPNVLTVYVDAPYDWRVEREMKRQGIGSSQAKHYIDKLDRYRESYYKYHTGRQWKRGENYDLCLDSAAIGLDNCVELIKKVIELKFDGKAK